MVPENQGFFGSRGTFVRKRCDRALDPRLWGVPVGGLGHRFGDFGAGEPGEFAEDSQDEQREHAAEDECVVGHGYHRTGRDIGMVRISGGCGT